jgi:ABC-type branched-chain amino acid transport systems, ATPase component
MSISTDTAALLEISNLRKSFGALEVTRDVSLALPAGARHALIGPNGAGKSTLINLLTGVIAPDAGRIRLGGRDITRDSAHARVRMGLSRTFQVSVVFPDLTPFEAVMLAITARERQSLDFLRPLRRREAEGAEALDILRMVNLADDAGRPTRKLAYGQQRLLEIALALAGRPKVLLLDEPAAGVPRQESEAVFSAIRDLPRDVGVLFIEHDMDLVFRFAEHIHVLVLGGLFRAGTPAEIGADPEVRNVYLGEPEEA